MSAVLDSAQLPGMFKLNPDGSLVWLSVSKYHLEKLGRLAGSPVPNRSGKKYWSVSINGRKIKRSRIVFALIHGRWPSGQIDHINGNSLDDRPSNLREATQTQNAWNHKKRTKRSPMPMGVRQIPSGRYLARIACNKTKYALGIFDDVRDAEAAYQSARHRLFGEFA